MGDQARLVWFCMINKVLATAFFVLILGRHLVDLFINEKKSFLEEPYLVFSSDKNS